MPANGPSTKTLRRPAWTDAAAYDIIIRMRQAARTSPGPVVSVRVSAGERELLELAAGRSRTSLSDFVRRKALEAAEIDISGQTVVTIPAEHWEKFEAWARGPAKDVPELGELATHRPAWEA